MVKLAAMLAVLGVACGVAFGAACGGGGANAETTPDPEAGGDEVAADEGGGDEMIPPERMDAIQRELDRKRNVASRCLTDAIEAGEADKNARGKITLEFVIGASGQVRQVDVVQSSIQSKMVEECVSDLVRKIDFGALSRDLEWSYTYAFEAF